MATTFTHIGPEGFTIIFAILVFLLHLFLIYKFSQRYPDKKYSWVVIVGRIIFPIIVFIGYMMSYSIIDKAIGQAAGGYHGYTFMMVFLYPFVFPVYWFIMWLFYKLIKSKIVRATK